MNRKLLNFILSGALLLSAVSFLSSCKDTSEDQFADLKGQIQASDTALKDQLQKAEQTITNLQNQLGTVQQDLEQKIKDLQAQIDALPTPGPGCTCDPTEVANLRAELTKTQGDVTKLQGDVKNIQKILDDAKIAENAETLATLPATLIELEKKIQAAEAAASEIYNNPKWKELMELLDIASLENLKNVLGSYECATLPEALQKMITDIEALKAQKIPEDLSEQVQALTGDVTTIKGQITTLQDELGLKASKEDLENLSGDVEEFKTKMAEAITEINTTIETKVTELETKLTTLVDNLKAELNATIAEWAKKVEANQEAIGKNKEYIDSIKNVVDDNKEAIDKNKQDIDQNKQDIDQNKQDIDQNKQDIDQNKQDIDQNKQDIDQNKQDIDQNKQDIDQNKQDIDQNKQDIEANKTAIQANEDAIAALDLRVTDLEKQLKKLLETSYEDEFNAINEKLKELDSIKAEIKNLKSLEDRLNNIINSIVIQQVVNHVFGSLSLPLGIQTNVLMAYHGYNNSGISEFPSDFTSFEYNADNAFTEAELAGVSKINVGHILLDESANNAGTLYFTVNPSNVNLKTSVFSLVNSLDNGCGIELSTPAPCDKLLMFGWSRADNGFYYSNANLSEANLDKCSLSLSKEIKEEIARTAKNFLHDLRHLDRPDVSQIATVIKNVLQSLNGQLPANAIKGTYQYKDLEGKTVKASTYSNYGIAAFTFQPQSFCFLEGQDNKFDTLPTIPTIDNFEFDLGKVKIDFTSKNFKVDNVDISVNIKEIDFNDVDLTVSGHVTVNGVDYDLEDGHVDDLTELADKITAKLKDLEVQINDDVNAQVNDIIDQINSQIDKLLADMSAEVNDQLQVLLDEIAADMNKELDKYQGKLNKLIKQTNKLIGRVNDIISHPNKYLQPLPIYNGVDGELHILSTSRVKPSIFKVVGGDATNLYFTSYTLEAIAPAYKKFVKVVKAWKNGDATRTNVASAVDNANAKGSLNKVINGNQIRFAFAPEAGYTYEIVFQALDYQGFTSTRRCFIEVR